MYEKGCFDPFWSDGVNLSLAKAHIINAKQNIEKELDEKEYPAEYYEDLPPDVPQNYMARPNEIREHAKASYQQYLEDENYQKLLEMKFQLSPSQRKNIYFDAIMRYVDTLKEAIETDDLVTMRRHEDPTYYQESFANCIQQIGQLKPDKEEVEQISFHLTF
ncbi:MAG: hypothetical protein KHW81_15945 [[Clostridium] innocuum]|nr:hypothetical protein [[Clostridium] innocuum]MBS5685864.1 hypothetical protein [[Clostridium] innocuum]